MDVFFKLSAGQQLLIVTLLVLLGIFLIHLATKPRITLYGKEGTGEYKYISDLPKDAVIIDSLTSYGQIVEDALNYPFKWVTNPTPKGDVGVYEIARDKPTKMDYIRKFKSTEKAQAFIKTLDPNRSAHDQVVTFRNTRTYEQRKEFRERQSRGVSNEL